MKWKQTPVPHNNSVKKAKTLKHFKGPPRSSRRDMFVELFVCTVILILLSQLSTRIEKQTLQNSKTGDF